MRATADRFFLVRIAAPTTLFAGFFFAPEAQAQVLNRYADQVIHRTGLAPGADLGTDLAIAPGADAALASAPGGAAPGVVRLEYDPELREWTDVSSTHWSDPLAAPISLAGQGEQLLYSRLDEDNVSQIVEYFEGPIAGVFGEVKSLALSGDYLVLGIPDADGGSGRVAIFRREEGAWIFDDVFDGEAFSRLGEAVAIDGLTMVAGAPGEGDCGAVHVYVHATSWIEFPVIDCPSQVQIDADFGAAVALDGSNLVVGAPRLDRLVAGNPNVPDAGGVYTFRTDFLLFELETFLRPAGAEAGDRFGSSVALWRIGPLGLALVAGAPEEDEVAEDQGAAYLYLRHATSWRERLRLVDAVAEEAEELGTSVAICARGVLAGEIGSDDLGVVEQGAIAAWNGVVPLFYDGFESADTDGWSSAVP